MPRLPFVSLALAIALGAVVSAARGESRHSMGRYWGVCWSDGYHSRAACPPKRHVSHHHQPAPAPTAVPWWKVPAADAEELPHPAGQGPATSRTFPPSGPSLLRQPGEGSSVTVSSAPNPAVGR
jgi:hypothetical protein